MEENKQGKGMSIASMVLGIISASSILLAWLGAWTFVGTVVGIVGLVLGIIARKQGATDTMMKVGIILSIVGIVINIVAFIACVGCYACYYASLV